MRLQFSAGIIVFRETDKGRVYLLLHYPHGHWDLAKGKLEKGETREQAAHRELMEETGLKAHIIPGFEHELSYFFKHGSELIKKTVSFFVGETDTQEVCLSHEHSGFAWLSYQDALERLSFENAKEILEKAELFLNQQ